MALETEHIIPTSAGRDHPPRIVAAHTHQGVVAASSGADGYVEIDGVDYCAVAIAAGLIGSMRVVPLMHEVLQGLSNDATDAMSIVIMHAQHRLDRGIWTPWMDSPVALSLDAALYRMHHVLFDARAMHWRRLCDMTAEYSSNACQTRDTRAMVSGTAAEVAMEIRRLCDARML